MKESNHPLGEEKQLSYSAILSQAKFLEGKVLTVVDASYHDEVQRKAVKDLIKQSFSEQIAWISQLCFPNVQMWSPEQVEASGVDLDEIQTSTETVVVEE